MQTKPTFVSKPFITDFPVKKMLAFNLRYFILTLLVFAVEVMIALFVKDTIIRPYVGDILVVVLIYCFLKSFFNLPVLTAALIVLLFSFTVETLQYFNVVEKLGLEKSKIARIVIGTTFMWEDFLCYIAGFVSVIVAERVLNSGKSKQF